MHAIMTMQFHCRKLART